jgi:hypothetical protein
VPEDLQKGMDRLYVTVSRDQETDFRFWLWKGFETVRNKALTDVERWTMEDAEVDA